MWGGRAEISSNVRLEIFIKFSGEYSKKDGPMIFGSQNSQFQLKSKFFALSWGTKGFGHAFYSVTMITYIHARDSWNLSYPSPQLFIASCDNKTPPLLCNLNETVVSVTSLATAWNALESWVFCQTKSNFIL